MLPGWSGTAVPLTAVARLKARTTSGPASHPPASRLQHSPTLIAEPPARRAPPSPAVPAAAPPLRAAPPPPRAHSASSDSLLTAGSRAARARANRPLPRPSRRLARNASAAAAGCGRGCSSAAGCCCGGGGEEPPSALLQQLAAISASSDALLGDMRKTFKSRFDRSGLLLELSTRYLLVGTCDSRFSGTARFDGDEVVYAFEHPTHRHVEMHMRYADMAGVRASPAAAGRGPELRFRIVNQLSYFTREYDPANEAHDLRIGFAAEADLDRFREDVLPHVLRLARS